MVFSEKNRSHPVRERLIFLKHYLFNPRKTGSVYPSSPALGKAMVSFLKNTQESIIIELGPGTGSITKVLLKSNIDLNNFYACEISDVFAGHLRTRFPGIHVREGDASKLTQTFEELVGKVDCIFSSLPLKSLPSKAVKQIIDQEYKILKPQGIVIQFTYDLLRKQNSPLLNKFKHIGSKIVPTNFPPARVDAYLKE